MMFEKINDYFVNAFIKMDVKNYLLLKKNLSKLTFL